MFEQDQNPIWCERYRPRTVAETILPDDLKKTFQTFVDQKHVPNLILSGRAGVGKTTVAKAMLNELGCDHIMINGSLNGGIDTLRHDIAVYASSVSLSGGRKYVILDEADYLNASSTQPALRNFMEEFSKTTSFILTCNFLNRIIDPLQSRCSVINFSFSPKDKPKLAADFFKRILSILDNEGVEYDKRAVAELINNYFPDWRRVLNELQRAAAIGKIDVGVLSHMNSDSMDELIGFLKTHNFSEARKWIGKNSDIESSEFFRKLFDILPTKIKTSSTVAAVISVLAEAQFKEAFVADSEINRAATVALLMSEIGPNDWS